MRAQPLPPRSDGDAAPALAPLPPVAGAAPVAGRARRSWIGVARPLTRRRHLTLTLLSFLLPLGLWAAFSYLPFLWHPLVEVTNPGDVAWMEPGMRVPRAAFAEEVATARDAGTALPEGRSANPVYLPAPHAVAAAFWTALTAPPPQRDAIWLPASLWHSIQIIFWGFTISSLVGVPLGILCGAQPTIARLTEPVIEFVRYLPAPPSAR